MASLPPRADWVFADLYRSIGVAVAAVAADEDETALRSMQLLHDRTTAWQRLPAHHQRRLLMHELGLLTLSRVEAPFVSLTSPASGPAFVSDKLDIIPDSTLFARLLRLPPSDFYEHTRLTVTEFLILYQELQPLIIRPRHADLEGEYSQEQRARFSHRKLHPADELLLWLYHADGNRHTVLCLLLDIDRTSITVITDHVTRCMNEAWKDEVRWPSREDREELHGLFSCHPKAVAAIDGTHCRIDVPDSHDREDTCYSAYKKYHTQNYLVCCDAFGFVVYIGGPFDGRFNDQECFLASSFCDGDARMLEADEKLVTDGGFSGEQFTMNIHPFTSAQVAAATNEEEKTLMISLNEEVVLNRSLNEHVNHVLKARAQALAGKWSRTVGSQSDVFFVAARFANRIKRLRLEYRLFCMQREVERKAHS